MIHSISDKKKHTGRNLVLLNAGIKSEAFFKTARKSSVNLAHFRDYHSKPDQYIKAFTDGDGIYFEGLNVAVVNFDKEDQLAYLNEKLAEKVVLVTEPERYVYRIDHQNYIRRFRDGSKVTWGIRATLAGETSFSGKGINIAILDTGIFKEHADLKGRKITAKKFVSSGSTGDADGHGTHCTGIACGFKDETGIHYGVAYESNIFCGKVLNDQGEGTDSSILAGIEWAISEKCNVISMSLGAASAVNEPYSETYEIVAKRAMQQGSLIIAAAGNESNRPEHVAPVGHPANCPSIVAVGGVDSNLEIAYFSCGGINKNGGQIDVVAPGVAIYSMINSQNEHEKWDGTSMATPFVAGIAGLYFEQNPGASPMEVWTLLTQHAIRLDISSVDVGSGLVQAPVN